MCGQVSTIVAAPLEASEEDLLLGLAYLVHLLDFDVQLPLGGDLLQVLLHLHMLFMI